MKAGECQIIKIWQIFKILRDLSGLRVGFFQIFRSAAVKVLYILGLKTFHNGTFKPLFFC